MLGYARILQSARGDLWDNPLRVGEVVRLRSGGPAMVVVDSDGGEVQVSWADGMGAIQEGKFKAELLARAKARRSFFGWWR